MRRRHKIAKRKSKRLFSRTGSKIHKKNMSTGRVQMRGGIRL